MAQDNAKVTNLINSIKNVKAAPVTPENQQTVDLINRIRGLQGTPSQVSVAPQTSLTASPQQNDAETFANQVANGTLTGIGYLLRVLTGLGRGITNAAYTTMTHANDAWDQFEKGDVAGGVGSIAAAAPDFAWGAFKGLATSVIPEFGKAVKPIDDRPIMEMGYDLFKSKEFKESAENLPFLKPATEDKMLVDAPMPNFLDKNFRFQVSTSGLSGLAWDILTDPASYATLGLGGALKGGATALGNVRSYQLGGKQVLPEGANQLINTSPTRFVLQQMGEGFKGAHRNAIARIETKRANRKAGLTYLSALGAKLLGKETPKVEGWTDTFFDVETHNKIIQTEIENLKKNGVTDPKVLAKAESDARQTLQEITQTIKGDLEGLSVITGRDTLETLRAEAAKNGTTVAEESALRLADRYALGLPKRSRVIEPRKATDINLGQVESLAKIGQDAGNPNLPDITPENFASAIDDVLTNGSVATRERVLKQLILPPGYREKAFKKATEGAQPDNLLKAAYGLKISAKGRKRPLDQEFDTVQERIVGTKLTRSKLVEKKTNEEKYLDGVEKELYDKWFGAGSKLASIKGPRTRIWTPQEAKDAAAKIAAHLKKIGVTSEDDITGQMILDAGVSPTLLASRIRYILNQEEVPSKDINLVTNIARQEFNPLTAEAENIKSNQFAFTAEERKAGSGKTSITLTEVVRRAVDATGQIRDPRLIEILGKMGIKARDLDSWMGVRNSKQVNIHQIVAELDRAFAEKMKLTQLKVAQQVLSKEFKVNGQKITGDDLAKEATRRLEEAEFVEFNRLVATKVRTSLGITDDELLEAKAIVANIFEEQVKAREALTAMGLDINSPAGELLFAAFTKTHAGRLATRTASNEDNALAALVRSIKNHPTPTQAIPRAQYFKDVETSLQNLVKSPNLPETTKAFAVRIQELIKTVPDKSYTVAEVRPIFARIGNFVKQLEDRMAPGESGFRLAFTQEGGEFATTRIPGFIIRAYRASVAKDSIDGGTFARHIDGLLASRSLPSLGEKGVDQYKLAAALKGVWGGDAVSTGLLLNLIRSTQHKGTRRYVGEGVVKNATAWLQGVERDATRFEKTLFDRMVQNIIEDENSIEQLIKANETQFMTFKNGQGGNMVVPLAENSTEKAIVSEVMGKHRLVMRDRVISLVKEYAKLPGADLRLFRITRDGQKVTNLNDIRPGDLLDHGQFSGIAHRYPGWLEANQKTTFNAMDRTAEGRMQAIAADIYFRGLRQAYEAAARKLAIHRATEIVKKIFPSYAKAAEVIKAVKGILKVNPNGAEQASVNMRARFWLADRLIRADRAVSQYDLSNTPTSRIQGFSNNPEGLKKQREQFEKLLNKVDNKLQASGVIRGNDPVSGMTFDEVIETGNPRMLIDWMRTFKVISAADKDTWKVAVAHLRNMTSIEKGSAYESYEALLEAYKANREGLLPGEINPVNGRPVPSAEQVLGLLAVRRGEEYIFGQKLGEKAYAALEAGAMPDRKTLMNWLRPIKPGSVADELTQARRNDFIHASQMVNGEAVRDAARMLEDPRTVSIQFQEALNSELEALYAAGLDDVITLAALAAGQSFRKFFVEGSAYKFHQTDALSRSVRATGKLGVKGTQVIKNSFEKETNLDGYKAMMQNLSAMAEAKGYQLGDPNRQAYIGYMMQRVLRLRDLYYNARGIFPSTSVNLKSEEAKTLAIFAKKEGIDEAQFLSAAGRGVMLSDSDVLDIFTPVQIANLFAIGPINSMPITTLLPPARFLVQALDNLPESRFFNEEELQKVTDIMMALMVNSIKTTSVVRGGKKVDAFDVDAEATYQRIALIIGEMINPNNALKLLETHTTNAVYATKALQYHAGVLSKELLDTWERILLNPMASTGLKIDETLKLTKELNDLLKIDMDDNVKLMLEMDSKVFIASHMDPDSVILSHEAEVMADSAEMAGIKAVQGKNQARIDAAKMREPLHQNVLGNKLVAASDQGMPDGANAWDLFNEHVTGKQEINWALKFDHAVRGRAFANTGFEDMKGIYGPVERLRAEASSEYEQIVTRMAKRWLEQAPGRNIMEEAWNVIREIPEEVLVKATHARETLYRLADKKLAGEPGLLDVDQLKLLQDESDALAPFLSMDDELLNRAVAELWKIASPVIGGGRFSLLRRTGLNAGYINRMIAEQGGGIARGFTDAEGNFIKTKDAFGFPQGAKDPAAIEQVWREWELSNPLDALVSLNSALHQASKVPEMAAQVNDLFAVPVSKFANAAEAGKAGYVKIQSVSSPSKGAELIHFMQTDDYYYPYEIALQLKEFSKFVTEIKHMQGTGAMEKAILAMNPIQNFAKQQMTLFTLKNWVQNTVGGFFTNGLAGVNNHISTSIRAAKMIQTRGINVEDLGVDLSKMDQELAKFHAEQAKTGRVVRAGNDPNGEGMIVRVGGKAGVVNWTELGNAFESLGGFPPVNQSRDLDTVTRAGLKSATGKYSGRRARILNTVSDSYGKISHKLGHWASTRDAWLRGQLWLDVMAKGNWKSFDEAAREAMKVVDRYHPQMQDLSAFNQRVTRQLVLFFTWRAKTLGWVMMDLLDKPGRALATLKAQYNLTQNEDVRYKRFGDFTPEGYPTPDWFQGNMDPLMVSETGETFKYSLANPVTDLLGSQGWLSGIDFNTYEPAVDQVMQIGLESAQKFVFSSEPLVFQFLLEWSQGTTMDGTKLGTGNGFSALSDGPAVVEDMAKRTGLGTYFTVLASLFPDTFKKASWDGELKETVSEETKQALFNWLSGIKLGQIDTIENRQKGFKELLIKLEQLRSKG